MNAPTTARRATSAAAWSAATPWSRVDGYWMLAFGLAAFLLARWYVPVYRSAGGVPSYYQDKFAPAVMVACGHGFVNVDGAAVPALAAFLNQRTGVFRCEELPSNIPLAPLEGFQGATRYLMTATALVWKVTGVGWQSVDVLMAALFALTVAAAYAATRMGCGRTLSIIVLLLWVFSPRHLHNLPHLRDYSKAVFFVVTLVAMGVAFVERRPRWLMALGVLFGAVQGLGFGMRTDVLINFIPFFVVLLAAPADGWMRSATARLSSAMLAVATFILVAFPVVATYARNSSLWHVVLLGLTSPFDENLNIGFPRPAYSFPYAYNDNYIVAVIQAYWGRVHPNAAPLVMLTPGYDRACREYFSALAETFPSDMATRMTASAIHIANLPFLLGDGRVPIGITNPILVWLSERRALLMERFNGVGPLALLGVLVALGAQRVRYVWAGAFLLGLVLTYPSLEFQGRHIFHLEFLVLALIAWGLAFCGRRLLAAKTLRLSRDTTARVVMSVAAVAALCALAGLGFLGARRIQERRVRALITAYVAAPADSLPASTLALPDGQIRLTADIFRPQSVPDEIQERMIKAEFAPDRCGLTTSVPVTFRYEELDPRFGLSVSRQIDLQLFGPGTSTQAFVPVYSVFRDWKLLSRFVGVDVPMGLVPCVQLWQVPGVNLSLWLPVTMTPDWPNRLYERLPLTPVPVS